jgi:hypothetical protein
MLRFAPCCAYLCVHAYAPPKLHMHTISQGNCPSTAHAQSHVHTYKYNCTTLQGAHAPFVSHTHTHTHTYTRIPTHTYTYAHTHTHWQGDFSWTVPDPHAYMLLPKKLIEYGDWHAFRSLMCDLRFIWRKMLENGVLSLLHAYEMVNIPLAAQGMCVRDVCVRMCACLLHAYGIANAPLAAQCMCYMCVCMRIYRMRVYVCTCIHILHLFCTCALTFTHKHAHTHHTGYASERLKDYHNFVTQHAKMLHARPNSIFQLGMSAHETFVRKETKELIAQHERIIQEWHDKLIRDTQGAAARHDDSKTEHRKQHVSAFETMRYVNMKTKLASMSECGMAVCLSPLVQRKLAVLMERLVQKVCLCVCARICIYVCAKICNV